MVFENNLDYPAWGLLVQERNYCLVPEVVLPIYRIVNTSGHHQEDQQTSKQTSNKQLFWCFRWCCRYIGWYIIKANNKHKFWHKKKDVNLGSAWFICMLLDKIWQFFFLYRKCNLFYYTFDIQNNCISLGRCKKPGKSSSRYLKT